MKDKDKLILLFNLQIGGMSDADIKEYIHAVTENFSNFFDNSVKCIFAPTRDESKPAVQAVTDFPWEGCELILQMKKYLDENNIEEARNCANAICDIAKSGKKNNEEVQW